MSTLVTPRDAAPGASATAFLPTPIYRLKNCEVCAGTRDILAAGVSRHIEPRAFDALIHLIEHRDRIVTKHELLRSVWGRVEVSDSVVARSIMKARIAIGDHGSAAPQIRTAHRVGYRFVGEVDARPQPTQEAAEPVGVVLLPFVNSTGSADLGWIELGLMSQVASLLGAEPGIVLATAASTLAAVDRAGRLEPLARARTVRMAQDADVAVLVEIVTFGSGCEARCTVVGADGAESSLPPLRGADPADLGEPVAGALRAALAPLSDVPQFIAPRAADLDEAFATEAHARANRAIAQQDWSRALPLLKVLAQQRPHDEPVQFRLLRVQSTLADPATPHAGLRLLQTARLRGDRRLAASVHHELARHSLARGGHDECDDHLDAAFADAEHCDDPQVCADLLLRAGAALHRRDLPAASRHLDASHDLVYRSGNRALQANWRNLAALLEFRSGKLDSAERLIDEALAIARPADLRVCVAVGLWGHARIRASLGRLGRAAALAREALDIAASLRNGPLVAETSLTTALLLGELGELGHADAGRDLLALLDTHTVGDPALCADLQTLARALLEPHAPAGAGLAAACDRQHHLLLRCDVWPALALTLGRVGRGSDAQALLARIRSRANETRDVDLRCGLAYVDGCMASCAGDRALARRCFAAATDGVPPSLWRARASLDGAWLAADDGDLAAATQLLLIAGHSAQAHPASLRVTARLRQAFASQEARVVLETSERLPSL